MQLVPLSAGEGFVHVLVCSLVPLAFPGLQVLQHPVDVHDVHFPSEILMD